MGRRQALGTALIGGLLASEKAHRERWSKGQHPRKKGPGIKHFQGQTERDKYDSTAARAAEFNPNAPDAPKKASRTRPASWGQPSPASSKAEAR